MQTPCATALSSPTNQSAHSGGVDMQSLFAMAFESSCEAKMICDSRNLILAVNHAFTEMTGYSAEEVLGLNPRLLASGQMQKEFYLEMWQTLLSTGKWSGELIERRKDGTTYPKFLSITAVTGPGGAAFYLASFIDISAMKDAHSRLEQLAHMDALTGLMNRHSFDAVLTQNIALTRRKNERMGLLYLDLDGFKKVNDSLGHAVGDDLLRVIAGRLAASVRESDAIARLGGDEFAVMLAPQQMSLESAAVVAERLVSVASQPIEIDGHVLHLGASVGIAMFPDDATSATQLMQHADTAMYEAKAQGKNSYHFFSPQLYKRASERLEVEGIMRQLLDGAPGEGFFLMYQPQFSLPERALVGVEALLRLLHPDGSVISPTVFIPIAEDTGLIHEIGDWVINEVCRQIREWLDAGYEPVPVSINISPRQFKSPRLEPHILSCTERYNVSPTLLALEITESAAMDQPDVVAAIMRSLKKWGIGLSIDDFGTGYSSLSCLPKLPLDTLKIDRSFVSAIESEDAGAAISAVTIALAHKLGLSVVAEGVETEGQVSFLGSQKCDAVQGFLLGRPASPKQVRVLLHATGAAKNAAE